MLVTGKLLEGLVAVPVGGGRARAGLEIDHSEPSGSRVAISRAGRRPPARTVARLHRFGGRRRDRRARAGFEIDYSEPSGSRVAISRAAGASGAWKTRGAKSNMRNHAGPPHTGTSSSPSSASSVGGRQIQGFDGGLEGGGCFLILVRVGCFLNLARQDAGGRGLVVR